MTRGLAELQDSFQRAILGGGDAVLDDVLDGPRTDRSELFDVYRHAYGARLVEVLENDFPALSALLGAEAFDAAARAYVAAHPSTHRNARWVGRGLPAFLAGAAPYAERPVLAELAAFEAALNDSFDAADAPQLSVADLAQIPPDEWGALAFASHPSARRLDQTTNATAIWAAISEGSDRPETDPLAETEQLIVWRQETTPRYRAMAVEEAMLWDEAERGATFAQLCTLSATYDDPDSAAARSAGFLAVWLQLGLLTAFADGA